jgi:hypothetical protein
MHDSYVVDDNAKFKRYLVGEVFWELEQHPPLPSEFANVARDSVEVLMYRYDDCAFALRGLFTTFTYRGKRQSHLPSSDCSMSTPPNKAPAPNRRVGFPLNGSGRFEYSLSAPPVSQAAVCEARR